MNRDKAKGYLGIARKAGYLIIGADNLKKYTQKMYILLVDMMSSNNLNKIVNKFQEKGVQVILVEKLSELIEIDNCKIVGVKNNGLALEIIKHLRGE